MMRKALTSFFAIQPFSEFGSGEAAELLEKVIEEEKGKPGM